MDRLLGGVANALAVPQRNAAALERLDKKIQELQGDAINRLSEGLDTISPAVFVQVMDSLVVRRSGASGEGGVPRGAFDAAFSTFEAEVINFLHNAAAPGSHAYDPLRTPACAAAAAAAAVRADAAADAAGAYAAGGGGAVGLLGRTRVMLLNRIVRETFSLDGNDALPAAAAVMQTPGAPEALLRAGLLPREALVRIGAPSSSPYSQEGDHFWTFVRLAQVFIDAEGDAAEGALQLDADGRAELAAWAAAQPCIATLVAGVVCARLFEGGERAEPAVMLASLLLRHCDDPGAETPLSAALLAHARITLPLLTAHAQHPAATPAAGAVVWRAPAAQLHCRDAWRGGGTRGGRARVAGGGAGEGRHM
ncbi:hypothetical protein MNEG_1509 [Monoraphidium neglectum]|uniref:Uncharacterized protein n=1 Tax=Monoraphidium neglectum TaxID=145388 RepID=A0A0D2LJ16_9CHLO|nr:hypothetical protein MNEG_1509 [Monoraphidium neglectum]KIZ06449.1 hypothetical protein MNEG_1509 [Monoraphidium neglectum]|eukprot:XP_013905468.1 hypothetical protein MNEG_1509 [Monoraphidium neglectum]